jgi:IstB-like ATP binding protein
MVEILALVRQHDEQAVLCAVEIALDAGIATKTHIATALGSQAVAHHRKKVRFCATVGLVNALEQEKAMNKADQRRHHHKSQLQQMGRRLR